MRTSCYRIANLNIAFTHQYGVLPATCSEYETNAEPDISITITQADIDLERERAYAEAKRKAEPMEPLSDGYLEITAAHRILCEELIHRSLLMFHGSALAVDGQGYIFTALSGTGKSTHARLWRENLGKNVIMINDDKPLLQITDEGVMVFGTPWDGKEHLSTNISVPLKAICLLQRDTVNHIEKISAEEMFPVLLQQTYRHRTMAGMQITLGLLQKLIEKVDFYRLGCNMEPEAALVAYEGLRNGSL